VIFPLGRTVNYAVARFSGSPENRIDFKSCPPPLPALPLLTNDYWLQKAQMQGTALGSLR
jgi:hypothetical protein